MQKLEQSYEYVLNILEKSQTWYLNGNSDQEWIFMCCLSVLFSFPFEVMDLDADGAKDTVPLSLGSPAANFSAETEITNPISKKKVVVKKTAAKSEPQSFRWVNVGVK